MRSSLRTEVRVFQAGRAARSSPPPHQRRYATAAYAASFIDEDWKYSGSDDVADGSIVGVRLVFRVRGRPPGVLVSKRPGCFLSFLLLFILLNIQGEQKVLGHQDTLGGPSQIRIIASAIQPPKPSEKASPVRQAATKNFAGTYFYKRLRGIICKSSM